MNEFLFLYRGGDRPTSAEQGQQIMQEWMEWFMDIAAKGLVADRGQPLAPECKVVQGGSKTVVDGPFTESKDIIGGYTVIKAKDLAEAAELAKTCPILERGGDVEVRPIMKIDI